MKAVTILTKSQENVWEKSCEGKFTLTFWVTPVFSSLVVA